MESFERLERYLSDELPPAEKARLERDLREDVALRELFESLRLSQRAVRLGAIRAEVGQAHARFMADRQADETPADTLPERAAKVGPLQTRPLGWAMRIAASVLLLVLGYAGYQLATLDGRELYADKFVGYQLPTTRGVDAPPSPLEARYRVGDFAGVLKQAATLRSKTVTDQFLEAMAHLQLGQYPPAIARLEGAQAANRAFANPLFEPEIEYYLALAYLGDGQLGRAEARLRAIHDNPRHPYREFVNGLELWKLRVAAWRE